MQEREQQATRMFKRAKQQEDARSPGTIAIPSPRYGAMVSKLGAGPGLERTECEEGETVTRSESRRRLKCREYRTHLKNEGTRSNGKIADRIQI